MLTSEMSLSDNSNALSEAAADIFFFFQAEDGIRDLYVTGLQTCALPISAAGDNSIAAIVKHVGGNLVSRWSDFLTSDGEKPGRDRDTEFLITPADTREQLRQLWARG